MSLVIDTSVVISVISNEVHKMEIVRKTEGEEILTPQSLHWEVGNAFSAMFKRNRISLETAQKAIKVYLSIPIRFVEVDMQKAIEIAHDFNIYAYDAYFIECALKHKTKFMSLDLSLCRLAKDLGIKLVEV